MMTRRRGIFDVLMLLGLFMYWGSSPCRGQVAPDRAAERERFLALLMLRQDQTAARVLVQQKAQLQRQLDRLGKITPQSPQRARQINLIEQRIEKRVQVVDQKIASPPPSPLHRRLMQQEQALRRQIAQIETRLERLMRLVTNNPRLARQIERVMAQLKGQLQRTNTQADSLERLAATPVSPLNVAGVIGGGR